VNRVAAALAAAVLLLAGCGGSGGGKAPAAAPKCSALLGDPHWVDKVEAAQLQWTCEDRPGHNQLVTWLTCPDGSKVYLLDIGQLGYWSVRGERLARQSGPAYARVFRRCG
jgi:hypothetical protein